MVSRVRRRGLPRATEGIISAALSWLTGVGEQAASFMTIYIGREPLTRIWTLRGKSASVTRAKTSEGKCVSAATSRNPAHNATCRNSPSELAMSSPQPRIGDPAERRGARHEDVPLRTPLLAGSLLPCGLLDSVVIAAGLVHDGLLRAALEQVLFADDEVGFGSDVDADRLRGLRALAGVADGI